MAGPIQLIGLPSVYPNAREITFNGATGENKINLQDNLDDALLIQEGSNKYISFVTSNGAERIEFGKPLSFDGATIIDTSGNNLLRLIGGTAGVQVDDTLSVGSVPDDNFSIFLNRIYTADSHGAQMRVEGAITGFPNRAIGGIAVLPAITQAATGTHATITGVEITAFIITDGGASVNVTNVAGLYITGAPDVSGLTNAPANGPYSIFVDAGNVRFDGTVLSNAGVQTVIAANGNLASANGADFSGTVTSITVVDGIVTAAS